MQEELQQHSSWWLSDIEGKEKAYGFLQQTKNPQTILWHERDIRMKMTWEINPINFGFISTLHAGDNLAAER